MTFNQRILTIAVMIITTMALRFFPFVLFPSKEKTPKAISYLGSTLPPAIFGFLIIYCVKHVSIFEGNRGIPEFVAMSTTGILHYFKKNVFLSIVVGTVVYMALVQYVY